MSIGEVMYRVYKITNTINDKVYIGQTLRTLKARLNAHKSANTIIGRAIRELGIQNFKIEEICSSEDKNDILKLEQDYIKKYNSEYPNGYNGYKSCVENSEKTEWCITFSSSFIKPDLSEHKFCVYLIRLLKYIRQDLYIEVERNKISTWKEIYEICNISNTRVKPEFKKWCTNSNLILCDDCGNLYLNHSFFKLIYS